jgi:hypothetical protein
MAQDYITASTAATLSEAELFKRYLDAPARMGATTSTLVESIGKLYSARMLFHHDCFYCVDDNFTEVILRYAEDCVSPSNALKNVLQDLTELVESVTDLKQDFERLAEVTGVYEPDEGMNVDLAFLVSQHLLHKARYVLPSANVTAGGPVREAI